MQPKTQAILIVITAAILWSTGGVLIKGIVWDGISIAGCRGLIAALILILLLRRRPRLTRGLSFWLTALFYSGTVVNFVLATKLTTAANAIFIQYMAPIYVAILAPFILKEPTSRQDWVFITIAFAGMSLFFMDSLTVQGFEGNLLALLSGVCYASFNICLRLVPAQLKVDSIIWGNLLAFAFCAPFINFSNPPGAYSCLALLGMACFQFAVPYYLFVRASTRLAALELTAIPIIEPILNPVLVAFIIGEWPGQWAMVGGSIVVSTVSIWSLLKVKTSQAGTGG
jgi:drug/metabolite transporter (DMT)-like permease